MLRRFFENWIYKKRVASTAIGGLLSFILRTILVGVCLILGFGPDKWAAFLMSGLPVLASPSVARLMFLLLASLTILSMIWGPALADGPGQSRRKISQIGAVLLSFMPFVFGAFLIISHSAPLPDERDISNSTVSCLRRDIAESEPLENIKIAVGNVGGDRESMQYANQFLALVDMMNIADNRQNPKGVNGGRSLGPVFSNDPKGHGVHVTVANRIKPPSEGTALREILQKCGIATDLMDFKGMLPQEIWIIIDRDS
jgi:hypothetical protein